MAIVSNRNADFDSINFPIVVLLGLNPLFIRSYMVGTGFVKS